MLKKRTKIKMKFNHAIAILQSISANIRELIFVCDICKNQAFQRLAGHVI